MSTQDPTELEGQTSESEAEPTAPVEPSGPSDTSEPAEPTEPSEPGESAEPNEPSESSEPGEQTQTSEPATDHGEESTTQPKPPPPPGAYGQIPQPGTTSTGEEYVPWSGRVFAYLIDAAPAIVIVLIANLIHSITKTSTTEVVAQVGGEDITAEVTQASATGTLTQVIATLVILLYWFWNKGYREGKTGKSIGKQALSYSTLSETTGKPIGPKAGCIRVLLLWVDFAICYIGVLWPLWDVKNQTLLSDRFTGAIVLKD